MNKYAENVNKIIIIIMQRLTRHVPVIRRTNRKRSVKSSIIHKQDMYTKIHHRRENGMTN